MAALQWRDEIVVNPDTGVSELVRTFVQINSTTGEPINDGGGGGGAGDASAANQTSQITQETATAAALGTTAGAAVITDANGTIQQYLRGLVKRWVDALGAGTAAAALRTTLASDDPAVAALGAVADAAATQGSTGSISAKLRTLTAQLNTQAGYLDGLETAIASTNTKLDTLEVSVDAVTTAINSGVAAALPAGTNNIGDVDVLTVPADPFGATADAAVTAGATGSISAKLRSISRDIVANIVLAAGSAAIGKLAANSGVDIGDVDVTTIGGQAPAYNSGAAGATVPRIVLATDSPGVVVPNGEYETVAASQSAQVLGATGATGDYLSHVMVQPTSTAPGVVTILDNAIEVHAYPGGTVSAALYPFRVDISAYSVSGAWKITTGTNVKCTGYGNFT